MFLTISANGLVLVVPKLISQAIDAYTQGTFVLSTVVPRFFRIAVLVFALTYLQSITQTYASERVARDLRMRLAAKIATQSYSAIEGLMPALAGWPFVTFLVYIVIIDFGEYWRHRLQHRLPWWWQD